jgi:hypothetical protein
VQLPILSFDGHDLIVFGTADDAQTLSSRQK